MMKRYGILHFVFGLFFSFVYLFPVISALAASTMTVETSVSLSDNADTPAVNDSTSTITLTFSEPLNSETVAGGAKLFRVKSTGERIEVPCILSFDNNAPMLVMITRPDGTAFEEGEEYKIVISRNIKSSNGMDLGNDVSGYFAINYTFSLGSEGIPELNNGRTFIIVISDIHMGDARTIAGGYSGFERNKEAFVNFMNQIRLAPNVKELVIAGDMLDEWIGPMDSDPLNGMTESAFVDSIAVANQTVIDALNNIITDGQIKVTYIPGNHDMLVTSEDMDRILPGISQARDALGLGAYTPLDRAEIVIEHGHRYELFCAPDPVSNRSITKTDSILPPGFFFTRIVYSSLLDKPATPNPIPGISVNTTDESQYLYSLYWEFWDSTLTNNPVAEGLNDKVIRTGIDGYTEDYAINDLIPYNINGDGPLDVNLYKGMLDTWTERQTINQVPIQFGAREALAEEADLTKGDLSAFDGQAVRQYFHNDASSKRIVVFGHTHAPRIIPSFNNNGQKTIYANSGSWQYLGNPAVPSMTFVVIIPQKTSDSTPEFVTVYQYSQSGEITKLPDQDAITNLEPTACVTYGMSYR